MSELNSRHRQYRVSRRDIGSRSFRSAGFRSLEDEIHDIERSLRRLNKASTTNGDVPDVEVICTLGHGLPEPHTVVVRLSDEAKRRLEERLGDRVRILDDDIELFPQVVDFFPTKVDRLDNQPVSDLETIRIQVLNDRNEPVPNANVALIVDGLADDGITGRNGIAEIQIFADDLDRVSQLIVRPDSDHWPLRFVDPDLSGAPGNTLRVTLTGFDSRSLDQVEHTPWGLEDMGLAHADRGTKSIRVAVMDSGIDGEHPDLDVRREGEDFGNPNQAARSWLKDASGHGTHVAGTVAAVANGFGVRGADTGNVELISLRVFPNGRLSKIIAALDWAVDNDVDVVNMSLGANVNDEGLEEAIQRAHAAGVILVAAAGNSAGPVLAPARYDEVLAVAAVGKVGVYPDNSTHAANRGPAAAHDDLYQATFTCTGREIDVCAPGVGVVSTYPGGRYRSLDGTSMASPHVAGLVARLLATDPQLNGLSRGPERARLLRQRLFALCRDIGLPGNVQGEGLPQFDGPCPPLGDARLAELKRILQEAIDVLS